MDNESDEYDSNEENMIIMDESDEEKEENYLSNEEKKRTFSPLKESTNSKEEEMNEEMKGLRLTKEISSANELENSEKVLDWFKMKGLNERSLKLVEELELDGGEILIEYDSIEKWERNFKGKNVAPTIIDRIAKWVLELKKQTFKRKRPEELKSASEVLFWFKSILNVEEEETDADYQILKNEKFRSGKHLLRYDKNQWNQIGLSRMCVEDLMGALSSMKMEKTKEKKFARNLPPLQSVSNSYKSAIEIAKEHEDIPEDIVGVSIVDFDQNSSAFFQHRDSIQNKKCQENFEKMKRELKKKKEEEFSKKMEEYWNKFELIERIEECKSIEELKNAFFSYHVGEDYLNHEENKDIRYLYSYLDQMISNIEMGRDGPLFRENQLETTFSTELWCHWLDRSLHSSSVSLGWYRAEREQRSSRLRKEKAKQLELEKNDLTLNEDSSRIVGSKVDMTVLLRDDHEILMWEIKPTNNQTDKSRDRYKLQRSMQDSYNSISISKSKERYIGEEFQVFGIQSCGLETGIYGMDTVYSDAMRFYKLWEAKFPLRIENNKDVKDLINTALAALVLRDMMIEQSKLLASKLNDNEEEELIKLRDEKSFGQKPTPKKKSGKGNNNEGSTKKERSQTKSDGKSNTSDKKSERGSSERYHRFKVIKSNVGLPFKFEKGMDKFKREEIFIKTLKWSQLLASVRKEISMLQLVKLNGVNHCVELMDAFKPSGNPNMMGGGRLSLVFPLLQEIQLKEEEDSFLVDKILRQLIEGLKGIHEIGMAHLDIKPSNLMVTKELDLQIIDFGHARIVSTPSLPYELIGEEYCGTDGYRAPEIDEENICGSFSDVYSCGITILYFLSPFICKWMKLDWENYGWKRERECDESFIDRHVWMSQKIINFTNESFKSEEDFLEKEWTQNWCKISNLMLERNWKSRISLKSIFSSLSATFLPIHIQSKTLQKDFLDTNNQPIFITNDINEDSREKEEGEDKENTINHCNNNIRNFEWNTKTNRQQILEIERSGRNAIRN